MSLTLRTPARILLIVLVVFGLLAVQFWSATPARAAGSVVYDSIPAVPPPSYPSLGYQATQTYEFGDLIELGGSNRVLSTVTLGMVSWACETGHWTAGCVTTAGSSFSHPITLNIYAEGVSPAPGAVLATLTDSVSVPYRPTSDPTCPAATQWRDPVSLSCQNGYLFLHTFDFTAANLTVPSRVIVSIAFSTTTYGTPPVGGAGGGYDSLNVAVINTTPTTGTDPDPDTMYWSGGAPVASAFAADTGWQNPTPQWGLSLRIDATAPAAAGGGGGAAVGGPVLALSGNAPNPFAMGGAAIAVVIGAVFVRIGFRRRPAHRA